MSAYEELVERCQIIAMYNPREEGVLLILSEVLRTLETVTDGMVDAASETRTYLEPDQQWLAMLHASPLAPPK